MKSKNSEDNDPSFCEDIDFFPGPRGPLTEERKQEIASALEESRLDLKFRKMLEARRRERVVLAEADNKLIAVKFLFGLVMFLAGIYFFIKLFIEQ